MLVDLCARSDSAVAQALMRLESALQPQAIPSWLGFVLILFVDDAAVCSSGDSTYVRCVHRARDYGGFIATVVSHPTARPTQEHLVELLRDLICSRTLSLSGLLVQL